MNDHSASGIITKIINRLLTHREMWAVSRGNLKTLPSDGQIEIIIKDLKHARKIIRWPRCSLCDRRPERGGNRPGSKLCQHCYEGD